MTSARRVRSNFALQRAVELAADLGRPLVILEALRCDYPWACDRVHRFVIDGMEENRRALADRPVVYYPYVEPDVGRSRGLIAALGRRACAVVTDWYPAFFLPRMTEAARGQVDVRMEAVDTNGLIPVAEHGRAYPTARGYRALVQRVLRDHLRHLPSDDPVSAIPARLRRASLPRAIVERWPPARRTLASRDSLARLPIDHTVTPGAIRGGGAAASAALRSFVRDRLARYADHHQHPDLEATSRLSPYLHFGHLSAHDVFSAVMTHERWTTRRLGRARGGAREGWRGVSPSAEAFLDQLVVWRELAFNGAAWIPDFERYESLPSWARATLAAHRRDRRPRVYSLDTFERAATDDDVWNAIERQLTRDGWFHGYLRMLWGKKILEWSRTPADALAVMEHLMNKYSLDGRDPVSYASFAWVLGRYDRPWPERPIVGTVRYMTSASAKRKLKMKGFLEKYG